MRWPTILALLAVGAPSPAEAAPLAYEGTLRLEFVATGLPDLRIAGDGVATVNAGGSGAHLVSVDLAHGLTGVAAAPVTDPALPSTLVSIQALASLGTGLLAPFDPVAPSSQLQLTAATLPVRGVLRLCLFVPGCSASLDLDWSQGGGTAGLGVGGLLTANGYAPGTRLSASAAPWTVRTAAVTVSTPSGSPLTVVAQGWLHGAGSFTSSTAITGGALSLVTPVQVESSTGDDFALFARITTRFLPEPGSPALLGSGLLGLGLLTRLRCRGSSRAPHAGHEFFRRNAEIQRGGGAWPGAATTVPWEAIRLRARGLRPRSCARISSAPCAGSPRWCGGRWRP